MQIFNIPNRPATGPESQLWFKNYCEMCDREQRVMQEMLDSEDYIKWLSEFSFAHNGFSTDQLENTSIEFSENDFKNIQNFRCFYNVIGRYADYHYIIGDNMDKAGFAYYVRYNGIVYKIGSFASGGLFYCKIVDSDLSEATVIEFIDVVREKNIGESSIVRERLNQLSEMIIELVGIGIKEDEIRGTVDDTMRLVKN